MNAKPQLVDLENNNTMGNNLITSSSRSLTQLATYFNRSNFVLKASGLENSSKQITLTNAHVESNNSNLQIPNSTNKKLT